MAVCNSTNMVGYEDESFFDFSAGTWSSHKIGWTVSGVCALLTTIITFYSLTRHALNYQIPAQQRQVGRILIMPLAYGWFSFLGYRWFRHFIYFELIETAFEGITLAAFLLLIVEFVSSSSTNGDIRESMAQKEKIGLPMTFGKFRFRASKPYFLHALKWSVLQYAFFRPLLSIVSIICEAFDKLCPEVYSVHFAEVYIEAFDFIVISVALYGLVVWYMLTKHELAGRQPLNKVMSIKVIVFAFDQSFIFSTLAGHGVFKATTYWTVTNISDGLNALCLSVEMVFFSVWMALAFPAKEYKGSKPRSFKNYLHFIRDVCWLGDFGMELWTASVFFWDYMRGRPGTHSRGAFNDRLEKAFGTTRDDQSIPLTLSRRSSRKGDSSSGPYAEIEELPGGRDADGTWR